MKRYIGNKREDINRLRRRCGEKCHLCGLYMEFNSSEFNTPLCPSKDHIIPRSKNGAGMPLNLKLAHRYCNVVRGSNELPLQKEMVISLQKKILKFKRERSPILF